MNRIRRSWDLAKSSVAVLTRHKTLLVFPVLIAFLTLGIAAFFLAPVVFHPTGHSVWSAAHWAGVAKVYLNYDASSGPSTDRSVHLQCSTVGGVYLAVLYFVSLFMATFCNVAFYHEIIAALRGQEVSIPRGFKYAASRWQAVLLWTLFAGLVGLLISWLEERFNWAGRLVLKFIGLAWSVAATFVIPVLVTDRETANPFEVLRRSAGVLRKTWGEALVGYVGVSFGMGLVVGLGFLCVGLALGVSVLTHQYGLFLATLALWLVALCAVAYVVSVAGHVFRGALYLYAADGLVTAPYTKEMFDQAWRRRT